MTLLSQSVHPSALRTYSNIPILSFFTGGGFLDLGFEKAGFQTTWANEFDKSFARGYTSAMIGYPDRSRELPILNEESIVDVGPNQIIRQAFSGRKRPEIFGMIGGPPCPDFSVGGKNRGESGERGKLSRVYIQRILELLPTFFLFENVPGLLRTQKHRMFFDRLRAELDDKYLTDYAIVNALEFGVPQDRERVFMVGIRRTWIQQRFGIGVAKQRTISSWFPWYIGRKFIDPKNSFAWPTRSPFGSTPRKPTNVPEELTVHHWILGVAGKHISKLPNGTDAFRPWSEKFHMIDEGDDSRKSFKRLHRWRYSPAAAYGNNEVHLHPTLPRRITVREAMRLQTVPDWYALPEAMPLSHKFKLIGNGVPVNLAHGIALAFQATLNGVFQYGI